MAGHTFAEKRAGNVAVPHIRRTLRGKRGSATHLAPIARETWQCHTSGARRAGTVAVPRITRVLWALAPVHYTSVSSSSSAPATALRAGCRVASASRSFFARSRLPMGEAIR